jgi:hypothetical protein
MNWFQLYDHWFQVELDELYRFHYQWITVIFRCFLRFSVGPKVLFKFATSAIDRARRTRSGTSFSRLGTSPWANRNRKYQDVDIFWAFVSCILYFWGVRGGEGLLGKVVGGIDGAYWVSLGTSSWANRDRIYSNRELRYPTSFVLRIEIHLFWKFQIFSDKLLAKSAEKEGGISLKQSIILQVLTIRDDLPFKN